MSKAKKTAEEILNEKKERDNKMLKEFKRRSKKIKKIVEGLENSQHVSSDTFNITLD